MTRPDTLWAIPLRCANTFEEGTGCLKVGTMTCSNCALVVYCGKQCQKAHWNVHKTICKCGLSKDAWRPGWFLQNYIPAFAQGPATEKMHNPFGGEHYLWGNVPAIDILKLPQNEGISHREDLKLLFAASGDMRNVVKTIAGLPDEAAPHLELTLNDRDFKVVARNVVLLLFALVQLEQEPAQGHQQIAESFMHLWYSAFLPRSVLKIIDERVHPLLDQACAAVASEAGDGRVTRSWSFSFGVSVRATFNISEWKALRSCCNASDDITQQARESRLAIVLAPERCDYRDRWQFKESSSSVRMAKDRFRQDGLFLPFGHKRQGMESPNPTLFDRGQWLMDDKQDPLNGWSLWDVHHEQHAAREDCYGRLFSHVRSVVCQFLHRLRQGVADFSFLCVDATELPLYLPARSFARVEASNICDRGYLGIRKTLEVFAPMLLRRSENQHATLVTLFLNAVMEVVTSSPAAQSSAMLSVMDFLGISDYSLLLDTTDPVSLRLWDARTLLLDAPKYFEKYRQHQNFATIAKHLGLVEKVHHTILDPWPTKVKLASGDEQSALNFKLLLASNFTSTERYVEWKLCDGS